MNGDPVAILVGKMQMEKKEDQFYRGKDDMPFHVLIQELMTKPKENPNEKVLSGCEIFFPDTVFYEYGVPKFIAMNDKDYCLAKWNENEESKKQIPNP